MCLIVVAVGLLGWLSGLFWWLTARLWCYPCVVTSAYPVVCWILYQRNGRVDAAQFW